MQIEIPDDFLRQWCCASPDSTEPLGSVVKNYLYGTEKLQTMRKASLGHVLVEILESSLNH